MSGPVKLSEREAEALRLYTAGHTCGQVARRMGVAESSVKSMLDRIRDKYAGAGRPAFTKIELRNRAVEDKHLDAREGLELTNDGLLGGGAWSPVTSPTAKRLGILYRPTGRLA